MLIVFIFSQKVQLKQKVADAFLERFQLKPHEVEALKNSQNEPITEVYNYMTYTYSKCFARLLQFLF